MKLKINLISIILFICTISILAVVILFSLVNMKTQIYETCCKNESGVLVFYECHDLPIGFRDKDYTPCSELKTGYYCSINGSEIKADELNCILNITYADVGI